MNKERKKISIIIPMYCEAERIVRTINRLSYYLINNPGDEVIFVDDGSKDETVSEVLKYKDKKMRLFCIMPNQGKWAAIRTGFFNAKNNYVAILDADLSVSPNQLNKYRDLMGSKTVVIGDRYSGDSKIPLGRLLPSRVFNWFVRGLFNLNFRDTQAPFKIFNKDVITTHIFENLSERRFAGDVEVLAFLDLYKYNIESVPVDYNFEEGSTLNVRKHSAEMLRGLIKIKKLVQKEYAKLYA